MNQTVWELDRERQLGLAHRDGFSEMLRLLEVPISLPGRDRTVPRQLPHRIGKLVELLEQLACSIETLGFLGVAGAAHMSYIYNPY
jgi:hypothetical protein